MNPITIEGVDTLVADLSGILSNSNTAMVRALNRAIASARTVMVQNIAKDTSLKSGTVRDALPIREATVRQTSATLSASLKRIPLYDFSARGSVPSRGRGRGVSYHLGGSRNALPRAFVATMANGHTGVFMRKTMRRLPIQEKFGPSLGHVFMKYRPLGLARAEEVFVTNFDHEMAWRSTHAS